MMSGKEAMAYLIFASPHNLCHPLPAPDHGAIDCGAGFPFYTCNATCDPGYEFPNGNKSDVRDCDTMFGAWFDPPGEKIPHCQLSSGLCRPLTTPNHGTISCGPSFPFYTCNATCDPGYEFPNGNKSDVRDCDMMFGDWFDPPGEKIPHCQLSSGLCRPLTTPNHGTISCGPSFPFYTCNATCDPGYEFPNGNKSDVRDCDMMFGDWFDPPGEKIPHCQLSSGLCRPLTTPNHGTISCGPSFPFYTCNATCDPGYEFPNGNKSDVRDCDMMFGDWFDPPGEKIPHCQLSSGLCRPLTTPNHGTISCGPSFPFYTCNATCDPGYEFPNGNKSDDRDCDTMFGAWFDPPGEKIPHCQLSSGLCRPLTAPNHGTIACGPGFPFYTCNATCDPSYVFPNNIKTVVRECDQMFGDWFGPAGEKLPDCQLVLTVVG